MFPVCIKIKSVFEIINSIRHNDIVREAIPHVYDTITEKNSSAVRIYISLRVTYCEIISVSVIQRCKLHKSSLVFRLSFGQT